MKSQFSPQNKLNQIRIIMSKLWHEFMQIYKHQFIDKYIIYLGLWVIEGRLCIILDAAMSFNL